MQPPSTRYPLDLQIFPDQHIIRRKYWTDKTLLVYRDAPFCHHSDSFSFPRDLLFPELWEDATAKLHALQSLLSYLHVGVYRVHASLNLFQLF